jgi:hypothetical protein
MKRNIYIWLQISGFEICKVHTYNRTLEQVRNKVRTIILEKIVLSHLFSNCGKFQSECEI